MKELKLWIIHKLGGVVLDSEEKAVLLRELHLPRFEKACKKQIEDSTTNFLSNAFSITYIQDDQPKP